MIGLKNINAWTKKSEAAKKRIQSKATEYVQNKVREVLKDALRVSPQFSGNMAVNWFIETNQTGNARAIGKFKMEPWQKLPQASRHIAGHPDAINYNLQMLNAEAIRNLKWNSKIRLTNYTIAAEKIEAGEVKLRPGNLIPGGVGVLAYLKTKPGRKFLE